MYHSDGIIAHTLNILYANAASIIDDVVGEGWGQRHWLDTAGELLKRLKPEAL